jgi:hypothetical protein
MGVAILTPSHTRWLEFINKLVGPEGCNLWQDGDGETHWQCDGDSSNTRKILRKHYSEVNIDKTLKYFQEKGACCDCEIVFNLGRVDAANYYEEVHDE